MKIKGIIFDLDGTLIKTPGIPMFNEILKTSLEKIGISNSNIKNMSKIWNSGKNNKKILKGWGVENPYEFWRLFDEIDYITRNRMIKNNIIKPFEDVKVIEKLSKKFYLGVVSNSSKEIVDLEIDAFKLRDFFKSIIFMGTEFQDFAKPEPYGLIWCAQKLGLTVEESIYVGDLEVDAIAGRRAGIKTLIINRDNKKIDFIGVKIINSLYQIEKEIGNIN
jgi:HAD superfamily hydrolase (TIGR01549 family)